MASRPSDISWPSSAKGTSAKFGLHLSPIGSSVPAKKVAEEERRGGTEDNYTTFALREGKNQRKHIKHQAFLFGRLLSELGPVLPWSE